MSKIPIAKKTLRSIEVRASSLERCAYLGNAAMATFLNNPKREGIAIAIPSRLGLFKNVAIAAFPKYAQRSNEDARTSILRKVFLAIGILLIMAAIYSVLAHPFFALFFPKYIDAVPYSR